MLSFRLLNLSAVVVVRACQVGICVTGVIWFARGEHLGALVALCSLALSSLPGRWMSASGLHSAVAVALAVLLAAHVVLGMYAGLYESSALYDKGVHLIGSAVVGVLQLAALRAYGRKQRLELPGQLVALMVFAGTLSAGTLWEFFEFAVDSTGLFVAQRGLHDTMIDLVADALGAILVLLAFAAARRPFQIGENRC